MAGAGGFFAGQQFPAQGAGEANVPGPGRVVKSLARETKAPPAKTGDQVRPGGEAAPGRREAGKSTASERLMESLEEMANSKQQGQLEDLLAKWLARNPEEMLQFLESSPHRDEVLRKVTALWAKTDAAAASSWLAAHPTIAGRDATAAGLAAAVVKDEPDAAVQWVATIKDPMQKLAGAQTAGYEFFRQSDESALAALSKMGMPASAIEPALLETWKRRLGEFSKRNAQNVASAYSAAKAAGADVSPDSPEAVVEALNNGIKGSGQFSTSVFKVDLTDLTEREQTAARDYLEMSGDQIKYTGGR
jgi:hypothetical protein